MVIVLLTELGMLCDVLARAWLWVVCRCKDMLVRCDATLTSLGHHPILSSCGGMGLAQRRLGVRGGLQSKLSAVQCFSQ